MSRKEKQPATRAAFDAVTVSLARPKREAVLPNEDANMKKARLAVEEKRVQEALRGSMFESWKIRRLKSDLQYFDLLPTASVGTETFVPSVEEVSKVLANLPGLGHKFEIHEWAALPEVDLMSSLREGTHVAASDDNFWHLKAMNLTRKMIQDCSGGANVTIAHPDSGYRSHPEFDNDAISPLQRDILENDPWCLVTESNNTHGAHGLATGSVIISRHNPSPAPALPRYKHVVHGIAPQAVIAPLRVTRPKLGDWVPSPVLFSTRNLRDAIHYAVDNDMDVISMSLGVVKANKGLNEAVQRAHNAGLILVAAAGNYTQNWDVYPAAYKEVISCAASNAINEPWRGSGWGNHVDVTAPGESVWRATVDSNGEPVVERSSGTSYATANVAGLAALWLSKRGGRKAVQQSLQGTGLTVGQAFKQQLVAACEPTNEISLGSYGHGLINASKLLA